MFAHLGVDRLQPQVAARSITKSLAALDVPAIPTKELRTSIMSETPGRAQESPPGGHVQMSRLTYSA
ncbi:hypothetical protein E4U53_001371 [Claviceps sorghi]|nr:hypothetical protein E4U53_001371 [Claviceps sorghi]